MVALTFWPEIAGDYHRSNGLHLQHQDQATLLNVTYSYHISHPSELRFDVRKNFEDFLEGKEDDTTGRPDDRPFQTQAADLMDQLALFEKQHGIQMSVTEPQPEQTPESELE